MKEMDLYNVRIDYLGKSLNENALPSDPVKLFSLWYDEALDADFLTPNAGVLSTVSSDNKPSSRIILIKHFGENGFEFYTDYNSRKSKDLEQNSFASLLFYWDKLFRQIRIEGKIKKVDPEKSDQYFFERPFESQIAAWASEQSSKLESRQELDEKYNSFNNKFSNEEIKRPERWGGYILKPDYYEFWQGREKRLHDRIIFNRENNKWKIERLAP